jgi:hypothetical protein
MPAPETYSYARLPNTGSFSIDIAAPTPSTLNETVTAYARCPGESTVTLGSVAGAAAGTALQIIAVSTDLTAGITYEVTAGSPTEEVLPNDTDGHFYVRRRSI